MTGMSSTPPSLLKRLLEGLRSTPDPVFPEKELRSRWPDATEFLLAERVLRRTSSSHLHEVDGEHRTVITVRGKRFLINPERPGAVGTAVGDSNIDRLQLNEQSFAKWIANHNGLDDVRDFAGGAWTIGRRILHGWPTRVFYLRSGWNMDRIAQITSLARESVDGEMLLVIAASFAGIPLETLRRISPDRLLTATLLSLTEGERIELAKATFPRLSLGEGDSNIFSRTGAGWTVRYGAGPIHGFPDMAGMNEIWFLLRSPGKNFEVQEIANELAGVDDKDAPVRLRGSSARSTKDLPPEAKKEFVALIREKEEAEEAGAEDTVKRIEGEIRDMFRLHGISDTLAGRMEREGDALKAEVERVYKATGRVIAALSKTNGLENLAKHLQQFLERRPPLSYRPDPPVVWRT